jgi:hypothetical protein
LAVSRFVAVREWHDSPMRQSPVIVDERLSWAGSFADEMSCRFRDCDPGPQCRLLNETTKRRSRGTAKIAHRCAAASGRVLDTRPAQSACEVGYSTSRIGSWRSLRVPHRGQDRPMWEATPRPGTRPGNEALSHLSARRLHTCTPARRRRTPRPEPIVMFVDARWPTPYRISRRRMAARRRGLSGRVATNNDPCKNFAEERARVRVGV